VFIEIALKGTPTDVCGRYLAKFEGGWIVSEDALLSWEESDASVQGVREMLKELGIEEAPHRDRTVCGKGGF
jgi:hypothetical protein